MIHAVAIWSLAELVTWQKRFKSYTKVFNNQLLRVNANTQTMHWALWWALWWKNALSIVMKKCIEHCDQWCRIWGWVVKKLGKIPKIWAKKLRHFWQY